MVGKCPEKQWKDRKSKSKMDFTTVNTTNRDTEQTIASQRDTTDELFQLTEGKERDVEVIVFSLVLLNVAGLPKKCYHGKPKSD